MIEKRPAVLRDQEPTEPVPSSFVKQEIRTLRARTGVGLVVLSTIAIGLVPSLAKLAYEGGSNPLTVIALRSVFMVFATGLVLKALGQTLWIDRTTLLLCLSMGLVFAVMSYGFLGAVHYIPISLTVLIFFAHPIFVAGLSHLVGEEPFSALKLVCSLVIFMGLGLVLSAEFSILDPYGMSLAFIAAITCAIMILGNARAMRRTTSVLANFYMVVSTAVVMTFAVVLADQLNFPETGLGWLGLVGTGVAFTVGLLSFFAAIPIIGTVRATLISGIEPILGILFAVAIFGEMLTPMQSLGAFLVICSVFMMEYPADKILRRRSQSKRSQQPAQRPASSRTDGGDETF